MPSVQRICFLSACSNALFQPDTSPISVNKVLVGANRRPTSNWKHRHHPYQYRRQHRYSSSATHSRPYTTEPFVYIPGSLAKPLHLPAKQKPSPASPHREKRHIPRISIHSSSGEAMSEEQAPDLPPRSDQSSRRPQDRVDGRDVEPRVSEEGLAPSPSGLGILQADDVNETRSMRSESSVSRNTNRLSLTLPIAPPNAFPTRPVPSSATMASYPPTPLDTPALASPSDPNDFITAIAAQERRVLDLREELERAELELVTLKRQWANNEVRNTRAKTRLAEPPRPVVPHIDTPEDPANRQSAELERRRALLLGQQATPSQTRHRRVFTGSHTRALSLLSPVKASGEGFGAHEDANTQRRELRRAESLRSPATTPGHSPSLSGYAPFIPSNLAKRASWQPRSAHQQTSGVKQIAEDFKAGLWTFMEDLRQATVGDEPVTGHGNHLRGIDGNTRSLPSASNRGHDPNHETVRTPAPPRVHATSSHDEDVTPTASSRRRDMEGTDDKDKENGDTPTQARHKSVSKAAKHTKRFSLTPLSMDHFDDSEWSSWETPAKSPRWSGSTANGDLISFPDETVPTTTSP
ncbi:hypothetical protein DL546_003692 [Coniochaeta pulveracea]|uniref:DUF4048 domain-containing protein n=1 Tax=Coniochaeta pulveracea TaxID=177199 RepID=A0A420Y2F5_9PEZI|nr:hypothetical protein DL546_003692 [Coniochaeta pulveracea]